MANNAGRKIALLVVLILQFLAVRSFAEVDDANEAFSRGLEAYTDRRFIKAADWYRKAVALGHLGAPSFIGHLYVDGEGVAKNYVLAFMWYDIGAVNGFRDSKENRDRLGKMMTASEIEEARKKAMICRNSNYSKCK
ncbi:MAG: hypothetical protein CMM58_05030 [Rhodospirillaceae bacterium]|nr:hypothetical protein [Rhodospirillaceae bacterium]|tara:strand:- start:64 stop:474 length:411 start_codon:yes stop_codon:yes gene_type:complete